MTLSVKKKTTKKTAKKIGSTRSEIHRVKRQKELPELSVNDYTMHPMKLKLRSGRIHGNEEKRKIAVDMLERYTGHDLKDFQKQIILTNFQYYTERFNALLDDAHFTKGSAFKA